MGSSDGISNGEQDVGHVLRNAGRRAEPPEELRRSVRAAVEAQWREAVAWRARRRRVGLSVAAGIALVAVSLWIAQSAFQAPGEQMAEVRVATGALQARSGWLARWQPLAPRQVLGVGEELETGSNGRAALALPDNLSVRLDHDTRVRFVDPTHIAISSGALYVDSGVGQSPGLQIVTPAGAVRHLGTQYEARLVGSDVLIAVREGKVEIATSTGATHRAAAGEQMTISSSGSVQRSTISPYDAHWEWTSATAPPFDIDGRSVADFLTWVARELGRDVMYADAQAQAEASRVRLSGSIAGLSPDDALAAVLPTTPLRSELRSGQLFVTLSPESP
jgi:ferric-dicitrate binding protein FerR (iron transport regulator)